MTLQDIVNYVLGNLGGRYEGQLGRQSPESAALQEINLAVKEISKFEDAPEWERVHDFTINLGGSSLPLPLFGTQRTRAISGLFYLEGTTWYPLGFLPQEEFYLRLRSDSSRTGRPSYFTYFANTLEIFPTLEQDTNFRAYLATYPPTFTGTDLPLELQVDPDWDTCIIAYATYKLFLRLQQDEDYGFWYREYKESKNNALHALRKRRMEPNFKADNTLSFQHNNPSADPFQRSWRP
jgi:hypothetical protein